MAKRKARPNSGPFCARWRDTKCAQVKNYQRAVTRKLSADIQKIYNGRPCVLLSLQHYARAALCAPQWVNKCYDQPAGFATMRISSTGKLLSWRLLLTDEYSLHANDNLPADNRGAVSPSTLSPFKACAIARSRSRSRQTLAVSDIIYGSRARIA